MERIKVNKAVEGQAYILNLSLRYLGIYAVIVLIGLMVLMSNFSFVKLVIISIILAVIYLIIQFFDKIDALSNFKKSKAPDGLINDLF